MARLLVETLARPAAWLRPRLVRPSWTLAYSRSVCLFWAQIAHDKGLRRLVRRISFYLGRLRTKEIEESHLWWTGGRWHDP